MWVMSNERVDGNESGAAFRHALGFMPLGLMLPQPLFYYRQTLAGMTPTTYFYDLDYLFALSKRKPKTAIHNPRVRPAGAGLPLPPGRQ